MNLYWIIGLTLYIWIEKMLPGDRFISRLTGVLLTLWGLWFFLNPAGGAFAQQLGFFFLAQKPHVQCIELRPANLFRLQTHSWCSDIVFMRNIDCANAGIIGIQTELHTVISQLPERV